MTAPKSASLGMTRALRVALESYGANALRLRAQYEMRRRFGLYRAAPRVPHLDDAASSKPSAFDVDLDRVRVALNHRAAVDRADRVAAGMHQAYRNEWRPLPRSGAEWNVHPILGTQYPSEPWWEMRRFLSLDASRGDVEGRVGACALHMGVRPRARIRRIARQAICRSVLEWPRDIHRREPPFRGIQWSCGQETSIRALSCLWAERGVFADAQASTAERRRRLADLFGWSGERVADAIEYAISQRNNHGISEAVGLIALGERLSDSHPDADRWLRDGARRSTRSCSTSSRKTGGTFSIL